LLARAVWAQVGWGKSLAVGLARIGTQQRSDSQKCVKSAKSPYITDIEDRKRADKALRASEQEAREAGSSDDSSPNGGRWFLRK
jgi:hypothetical protein